MVFPPCSFLVSPLAVLVPPSGDIVAAVRAGRRFSTSAAAARLRQIRECLGLSQREMAAELSVAHGAVGLWESGARPVPGPVRRLIALYEDELGLAPRSSPGASSPFEALPVSRAARSSTRRVRSSSKYACNTVAGLGRRSSRNARGSA